MATCTEKVSIAVTSDIRTEKIFIRLFSERPAKAKKLPYDIFLGLQRDIRYLVYDELSKGICHIYLTFDTWHAPLHDLLLAYPSLGPEVDTWIQSTKLSHGPIDSIFLPRTTYFHLSWPTNKHIKQFAKLCTSTVAPKMETIHLSMNANSPKAVVRLKKILRSMLSLCNLHTTRFSFDDSTTLRSIRAPQKPAVKGGGAACKEQVLLFINRYLVTWRAYQLPRLRYPELGTDGLATIARPFLTTTGDKASWAETQASIKLGMRLDVGVLEVEGTGYGLVVSEIAAMYRWTDEYHARRTRHLQELRKAAGRPRV